MKLTGSVDKLEDVGDAVRVTLANVRRKKQALWRSYGDGISFQLPHSLAKRYPIGTSVDIVLKPRK